MTYDPGSNPGRIPVFEVASDGTSVLGAGGGRKVEGVGTDGSPSGGVQSVQSTGRSSATATIANGESLSAAVDLGVNMRACGIIMPAAWTAADMTFQTSVDGVTYNEMLDSLQGTVQFTVAASQDFALDPALWERVRYLKVRSGTLGAAVNQGASRAIVITTVPV